MPRSSSLPQDHHGWQCLVALCLPLLFVGCTALSFSRGAPEPPALIKAVKRGDVTTVRSLLARGTDVQIRDAEGRTALMYAAGNGDPTTAQALLTNGADVNAVDTQGWTPLMHAAENGEAATVQALLSNKAHVNAKGKDGWTALMAAASRGHLTATQALLANGAEADARDKDAQTALFLAVQKGHTAVVQALLDGGADVNTKNKDGKTPVTLAEAEGFTNIAQMLKQPSKRGQPTSPPATVAVAPPAVPPPAQGTRAGGEKTVLTLGRHYALVIGNNAYTDMSPLKTAVPDAKAVSELLGSTYGFAVTTLINATRDDIIGALDRFRNTLTAQDDLLIYYAGHGILDTREERGYWLPVNAKKDSRIQWVSNTTITDALKAMAAKHVLVVADSCYSGTLVRGIDIATTAPGTDRETYIARIAQKRSRTVLTSGGLEPVLDSGGGEHSVFAQAFLTVLQDNTDVLDGQQLFSNLRRPVILNASQTPEYTDIRSAGHEGGDFLFIRQAPPAAPVSPAASAPPVVPEPPAVLVPPTAAPPPPPGDTPAVPSPAPLNPS